MRKIITFFSARIVLMSLPCATNVWDTADFQRQLQLRDHEHRAAKVSIILVCFFNLPGLFLQCLVEFRSAVSYFSLFYIYIVVKKYL